jgi:hypothetical protein
MAIATFSGNGNYRIDVDAGLSYQTGLTSVIYWRILVHKSNTTGHRAWGNNGSSGYADASVGRVWTNGNMEYNFQNGSMSGTFTIAEGTFNVQHRADGHAEYYFSGGLTLAQLGSASATTGWRSLPHIQTATVPQAPTPLGVDQNEMTSLRYRFSGNGDGGAPILEWQALWQEGGGPQNAVGWQNGTFILTGLKPATNYNFWSRGRNSVGWGPWSAISSGRTISGARVKQNGVWKEAVPYVKQNGAWKLAQPYSKVNGIWRKSI